MADADDLTGAFTEALYRHLEHYIAHASYPELHALVDVLGAALKPRVGQFAPRITVALEGVHGPLIRQERLEARAS